VLSLLLFQFSFVTLSFSKISVDLKDVEGNTIELAIESGNGDIRHCILPGGDEDLNFLTIQLEFSDGGTPLIVNSYRIDWGDGSPVSTITEHNSNSIEHVYPGTNNAGNPFYELEIMEIMNRPFQFPEIYSLTGPVFCTQKTITWDHIVVKKGKLPM
jgi:hypothetical protein